MKAARTLAITLLCRLLSSVFAPFSRRAPLPEKPASLLVIKPCCLGDVLMATPVVRELRARFPKAHLAFLVSAWAREAIAHNPHLDEIIESGRVGSGAAFSWREYGEVVQRVRQRRFSLCVVLDRSPLMTTLPWLAGIPYRVGIDSAGRGFALTVKVAARPTRHETELYLDTLRALGMNVGSSALEFLPTPADHAGAAAILPAGTLAVALHPGGGENPGTQLPAKRWPAERYAQIAGRLLAQGCQVFLVGGPADREASHRVSAELERQGPVGEGLRDVTGQTSLGQLGALVQRCTLFVGNDSAPLHLAAAVGTPTVAIFGPSDPTMYAPRGPRHRVLAHREGCPQCRDRERMETDLRPHACILAVTVDEVWQALIALLPTLEGARQP